MDISSGIQASLAGRYALALFGLARDEKQLESVAASLDALKRALAESPEFAELATSPLIGRAEAAQAVVATAEAMGLDPLTRNFVGVLARNGRLAKLGEVIRAFDRLAADHRGEIRAEVTSARPLDDEQLAALRARLKQNISRDIAVETRVDPEILGGLVVKIGSRRIDGSIRTKLNNLALAMKG